jgi:hypothetical protein
MTWPAGSVRLARACMIAAIAARVRRLFLSFATRTVTNAANRAAGYYVPRHSCATFPAVARQVRLPVTARPGPVSPRLRAPRVAPYIMTAAERSAAGYGPAAAVA